MIFSRFGTLLGPPGFDSGFGQPGKDAKLRKIGVPSCGWERSQGLLRTPTWCDAGSTWRKILSRVPRGRPHFAKKASFNTHSPKPSAMLDALTRPGPRARRIIFVVFMCFFDTPSPPGPPGAKFLSGDLSFFLGAPGVRGYQKNFKKIRKNNDNPVTARPA